MFSNDFGALGRSRLTPVQRNRPGASKDQPPPVVFYRFLALGREPLEGGLQLG